MKEVNASIITIGDELLIGQTIDTNSAFIAQELNKIGVWVKRRIAVGDVKDEILNALKEQSQDWDLIIITGGLGPTADDITKPALCEYFNSKLIVNEDVLQNVKNIFGKFNKPVTERNSKQAEVPHNCTVLPNKRGTAPGMLFEKDEVIYISLPGVPNEMKGLIENSVLSKLKEHFQLPVILHRTALVIGKGESEIAEMILHFENSLPNHVKLAYLPSYGMLRLRLTAKGEDAAALEKEIDTLFSQLKEGVKDYLAADEDITLQEVVINLLKEKNKTVATAESCTGGYIAHLITSIAGSSAVYNGSVVSYANAAKENILDVQQETLQQHGAVSEETVTQMVKGVLHAMNTDYALATSGIMGPDGGTSEKPVGLVWIGVGNKKETRAYKINYPFERNRNIQFTAMTALNLLRRFIIEQERDEKTD
jgi:nicotinamide-nucleotide amidase